MYTSQKLQVAVLLPTYNGEKYVEQQIRSLRPNETDFTLHWLDDHSTDNTREIVRSVAASARISLREWHQPQRLGVPCSFFQLLECVEADIYLFCDQDDIWQPGKISATVDNLLPDLPRPVICFSDPLLFREDNPERGYRLLDIMKVRPEVAMQESRTFMALVGYGNTQGFTKPLRDLYVNHKDVAREYAAMHDIWMYNVAVASGGARLLSQAPTTLYRWHATNSSEGFGSWGRGRIPRLTTSWKQHQNLRRAVSRNAEGFILASETLPESPKLTELLSVARLVSSIRERQSPAAMIRLTRHRAIWACKRLALESAAVCLCSDAGH
jgi:hypothetical protein